LAGTDLQPCIECINFTRARRGSRRPTILLLQVLCCCLWEHRNQQSPDSTETATRPISAAPPRTQSLGGGGVSRACFQPGRSWKSPTRLMRNHQGSEPLHPQQGSICKISWGEILAPTEMRGNSL